MIFLHLTPTLGVVKRKGQLAQLSSCCLSLGWLPTLAISAGQAATYLVLGRPRKALYCLRGRPT